MSTITIGGKTYITKSIKDLDKKLASAIVTKSNWSVEIGDETASDGQTYSMLLSELETLIGGGGGGGGSRIEDADSDTYVDTESGTDTDIVEIGSPNTGTNLIAKFINGSTTEVLQVDGNGNLFQNGNYHVVYNNANSFLATDSNYSSILDSARTNVFIGGKAGNDITSADDCIFIGYYAGYTTTTSKDSIAIGRLAGYNTKSTTRSISIGSRAAQSGYGTGNINFGYFSGINNVGNYNVFLGYYSGGNQTSLSNHLIIDNQDRGSAATELTDSLIVGEFNATKASQWLRINGVIETNGVRDTLTTVSTTPYTVTVIEDTFLADASTTGIQFNLPAISSTNHGQVYTFIVADNTNTIQLDANGTDTINSAANYAIGTKNSVQIIADNNTSNWYIKMEF
jgi:hypothetical protein